LASTISAKWKQVDTAVKNELIAMAELDKERYNRENEEWKLEMLRKAEVEQADAAKVAIGAKPSEDVTLESDINSKAEVNSIVKPSPLASAGRRRHTVTGGIVPPLPFQTDQVFGRHPCFPIPLGDDASYMPFSQQPEPSQQTGGVFQFSDNGMQGMDSNMDNDVAYRITPDRHHPRQFLELLLPQVEAFDFLSESFKCAPCFSTTAGRRVSCGDIDSYCNASSPQGMSGHGCFQNDNFVMPNGNASFSGCIDAAGFQNDNFVMPNGNTSFNGCIDASGYQNENFAMPNGNKEGPEYMRGFMQGFKVACEMWDKIGV
jgi:hypothetical protein